MSSDNARCFAWDWRGQLGMAAIAAFVSEISGGKVTMREVDTGTDGYAWVVADHEVGDEEATELWRS